MSLKNLKSKSESALDAIPKDINPHSTQTRPVTAPGATAMMQPTIDALNDRAKSAESRAAEAERHVTDMQSKLNDSPKELALDVLVEVEGRRRRLTPDQFEELRANLAENPLVQPVVVKMLSNGRYELISGHNRVAVYRLLGRANIPVTVADLDDSQVERGAFFANLLQPALPDYEKYLGFKKWQDETGDSQAAMAQKAGTTKNTISRLFAFGELPLEAIELITEKPEALGARYAVELARLAKAGKKDQVIEAIQVLTLGTISQVEAVKMAAREPRRLREKQAGNKVKIKAGRLEYCRYEVSGGTLRIDFRDPQERLLAEEEIAKVLKRLAEQAKAAEGGSSTVELIE